MTETLKKIAFDYSAIALKELFYNTNIDLPNEGVVLPEVRQVLGRDLMFGTYSPDRPYTYCSMVLSIDGKIAFPDAPQGPLIARNNKLAGAGSIADYWILNVLRGASDAILCGTQSIAKEVTSGGTGHCYDERICQRRLQRQMPEAPWRIVVTLDGSDIPYEAAQFTHPAMASFFYTTAAGVEPIRQHSKKPVVVLGPYDENSPIPITDFHFDPTKSYVIVTNHERAFDNRRGLRILKAIGVNALLVESPTVSHILMQEQSLDELFLNQSGLYIGGRATTIGQSCEAFTSTHHPHTELISLHLHSPHFLYSRYRLRYD